MVHLISFCKLTTRRRSFFQEKLSITISLYKIFIKWYELKKNFIFIVLLYLSLRSEKAMALHSNTLAWKIPWKEEPGRLQSMGSWRVGHDWATSLSIFAFHFHALEKEMATHSNVLAWRIPGTAELGGLLSVGSHRVGHDWSNLAAASITYDYDIHYCNFSI